MNTIMLTKILYGTFILTCLCWHDVFLFPPYTILLSDATKEIRVLAYLCLLFISVCILVKFAITVLIISHRDIFRRDYLIVFIFLTTLAIAGNITLLAYIKTTPFMTVIHIVMSAIHEAGFYRFVLLYKSVPTAKVMPLEIHICGQDCNVCPCSICLDKMNNKHIFTTNCRHAFHANCIAKWKEQNNTCPICRSTLVEK